MLERTELPCIVKSSVPGIRPTQEISRKVNTCMGLKPNRFTIGVCLRAV